MNFLLEFVCFRCSSSNPPTSSSSSSSSSSSTGLQSSGGVDETRFLVQPPPRRLYRRIKRGSSVFGSGSGSVSVSDWQPSLSAISEDGVVATEMYDKRRSYVGSSERMVKRKNNDRPQFRGHSDDIGQSFSVVIPAFSPTPFMF